MRRHGFSHQRGWKVQEALRAPSGKKKLTGVQQAAGRHQQQERTVRARHHQPTEEPTTDTAATRPTVGPHQHLQSLLYPAYIQDPRWPTSPRPEPEEHCRPTSRPLGFLRGPGERPPSLDGGSKPGDGGPGDLEDTSRHCHEETHRISLQYLTQDRLYSQTHREIQHISSGI